MTQTNNDEKRIQIVVHSRECNQSSTQNGVHSEDDYSLRIQPTKTWKKMIGGLLLIAIAAFGFINYYGSDQAVNANGVIIDENANTNGRQLESQSAMSRRVNARTHNEGKDAADKVAFHSSAKESKPTATTQLETPKNNYVWVDAKQYGSSWQPCFSGYIQAINDTTPNKQYHQHFENEAEMRSSNQSWCSNYKLKVNFDKGVDDLSKCKDEIAKHGFCIFKRDLLHGLKLVDGQYELNESKDVRLIYDEWRDQIGKNFGLSTPFKTKEQVDRYRDKDWWYSHLLTGIDVNGIHTHTFHKFEYILWNAAKSNKQLFLKSPTKTCVTAPGTAVFFRKDIPHAGFTNPNLENVALYKHSGRDGVSSWGTFWFPQTDSEREETERKRGK